MGGNTMIGYVTLGTNDLPRAAAFYDALADNESAIRELPDDILKKIAHELTENLRASITVDWSLEG